MGQRGSSGLGAQCCKDVRKHVRHNITGVVRTARLEHGGREFVGVILGVVSVNDR